MRALVSIAALALALAGCVSAPPPKAPVPLVAAPLPTPPVPAPAPLAADWRDWPVTPGTWTYARSGAGSSATFGGSDRRLLVLSCDADRRIRLTRPDQPAGTITIRTSSATRVLATQPTGAIVALTPTDPLLDAIGFSRGRFIVEQAGTPMLVVPAWAEIERVTEDCRG